jgi:uncharacterized OsmC-like protein
VSRHIRLILALCLLLLALPLATAYGQASSTPAPGAEEDGAQLVTASARANLVEPMRTIVHARGNHWVVDSVPPLGSPSEETNPLDMFLGAMGTCPIFVYEKVANDLGIPLTRIEATVEGDFAPQGVRDGSVDPRIRAFRIIIDMEGPTAEEASMMREEVKTRCPIYTTLVRSAPIEIIHLGMDDVSRQINFKFGDHIELGFPEQHVLVQQDDISEDEGIRIKGDQASDEDILALPVYAAADDIGHDPFELEADALGPFALGEELGVTMGEWLAASGGGVYKVTGDSAEVHMRLANLVPEGVYTLWCSRVTVPPDADIVNEPCGDPDGTENMFTADEDGNAEFAMELAALPDTDATTVSVLALAYHSDGNTYGASPGIFGVNSHVQVFTMLPPFADRQWKLSVATD